MGLHGAGTLVRRALRSEGKARERPGNSQGRNDGGEEVLQEQDSSVACRKALAEEADIPWRNHLPWRAHAAADHSSRNGPRGKEQQRGAVTARPQPPSLSAALGATLRNKGVKPRREKVVFQFLFCFSLSISTLIGNKFTLFSPKSRLLCPWQ